MKRGDGGDDIWEGPSPSNLVLPRLVKKNKKIKPNWHHVYINMATAIISQVFTCFHYYILLFFFGQSFTNIIHIYFQC